MNITIFYLTEFEKKKIDNIRKDILMIKRWLLISGTILVLINLFACNGNDEQAKSMEQIYKEEGVPVKIRLIQPQLFEKRLNYNAVLTGIEESTVSAKLTDRVEKVLVNIGDYVKKDQVLVTFPTDNPTAQYQQAKLAYDNAKSSFDRIKNLYDTGGISQQNYDNTKTQYEVAKANFEAVSQMVKVLAPMNGYVTGINVVESENVKRDEVLVTISRTDKLKSKVWISEKEICQVKIGLPALATWNGQVLHGKVVQVDMAINQNNQAFGAVLEFENNGNGLYCGVTSEIQIITSRNPEAIVVNVKDILKGTDGDYVFVNVNGQAQRRMVVQSERQNLDVEIVKGLNPGDQLVIEGQLLLGDGSKLNIID
jgi:membrane fusion protein (multidrug efflux system)